MRTHQRHLLPAALAFLFLLAASARGDILKDGIGYNNYNFSKVILTYSWSGHYPGQGEVCLLPQEVTVPAGGSVHLDPPPGFIPTDFVVISRILRGKELGGYTIYDPPSTTEMTRIEGPCPAEDEQVWGYLFFGETDFGPVFANAPMAMDGFTGSRPNVVAAEIGAGGPVVNTSGGHCFVATVDAVLADSTTTKVQEKYRPKLNGRICDALIFGPSDLSAAPPSPTQP